MKGQKFLTFLFYEVPTGIPSLRHPFSGNDNDETDVLNFNAK